MNVSVYPTEDYENQSYWRHRKKKPNQTQSVFLVRRILCLTFAYFSYLLLFAKLPAQCDKSWRSGQSIHANPKTVLQPAGSLYLAFTLTGFY